MLPKIQQLGQFAQNSSMIRLFLGLECKFGGLNQKAWVGLPKIVVLLDATIPLKEGSAERINNIQKMCFW